jgi:hypothetical protein
MNVYPYLATGEGRIYTEYTARNGCMDTINWIKTKNTPWLFIMV